MHLRARRRAVVVVSAIAAVVVAGCAAAFWLALGNGSGGNRTGTASAVTLSPAATTAPLFPGSTADVAVSIVNGNPSRIFVASLVLDPSRGVGGFAVDAGHAGCNLAALGYTTQSNGGSGWSVAASSTLSLDLTGAASLSTAAVSACQGARITIYLRVGP